MLPAGKSTDFIMRYLYCALFYVLVPFLVLRMLLRSRRAPAYRRRLAERLGHFDRGALDQIKPSIWVHAVSVGEAIAAAPIIEALLLDYPGHQLVVTTTTPTGSERVRALFGTRVFHVYAPWDLPGATCRFLDAVRPSLLLLMETELWPNMIHHTAARGCPILLANARLSERSARGYERVRALTRPMLGKLSRVACQSVADGERFQQLGLAADRIQLTGSIKFDISLGEELQASARQLRLACGTDHRIVLVAASTHAGEDEQILSAFFEVRACYADALLILVPRHPERFDRVYQLAQESGFKVLRRSSGVNPYSDTEILLGDTMGELLLLLGVASVAIVGGSLVDHGGHNVLEAAAWGAPVVTGPYMFNFAEISDLMVNAGAMIRLDKPDGLTACLLELLGQPQQRQQMGSAGLEVIGQNCGAKARLLAIIAEYLPGRHA
ncbi:MAG: 3-deoxy-D-manno-octulosonic-acid transferase [Alcanivorax sp.]|jgi:3-deoxy-D-manno-octulosonic-acid transferase